MADHLFGFCLYVFLSKQISLNFKILFPQNESPCIKKEKNELLHAFIGHILMNL